MMKKLLPVLFGILLLVALAACSLPQPPGYGNDDPGVSADPTPAAMASPEADYGNPTDDPSQEGPPYYGWLRCPKTQDGLSDGEPLVDEHYDENGRTCLYGDEGAQILPEPVDTFDQGNWEITTFEGVTDQMTSWLKALKDPAPERWPRFPNVDNPQVGFVAANGLEYGLDESVFMEQNELGRFPIQARGYRAISGDYEISGVDSCEEAKDQAGCAIALFNVGEVTADLEAWVRQGFTVSGRNWNQDALEQAMWGLASHVSANMLNYPTYGVGNQTLNEPDRTNAGANCSVPEACERVRFTIAIMSGNQLLALATTFVER